MESHKEFNANLYPEEPVKKLWSLLKLNDKEYSLTSTQAPHKPLRRGSIGEHSKDNDLSLVLSKTKTNNVPAAKKTGSVSSTNDQPTKIKSYVKTSSTEGTFKTSRSSKTELGISSRDAVSHVPNPSTKAKTELTTTSKEGSNVTNVNININIDSHTSLGERAQVNNVDQTKQEPFRPEKNKTAKKDGSRPDTAVNQLKNSPTKLEDRLSKLKLPITPKTRAKALSEHLSQSSLHRKSFQSISYRGSPVRGTVQTEPVLLDKERPDEGNGRKNQGATGSKEFSRTSPHSSTGRVPDKVDSSKNLSNNLKDGIPTAKEDNSSVTSNKPKTIPSSQSLKGFDKKTSSKSSFMNKRLSVSKSSLEKKVRKGSSKLLTTEGGKKRDTLVNKPSRSPSQAPVVPTDIMFEIHSPNSPSLEQQKRADQGPPEIYATSGRKSSKGNAQENSSSVHQPDGSVSGIPPSHTEQGRDSHSAGGLLGPNEKQSPVPSPGKDVFGTKTFNLPGRKTTLSPEGNKVDPIPLGTTPERRVSSNKGKSRDKHNRALSPGKDAFDTKKSNSPGREPTLSPEGNKVDPIPLGTTLERRVSSNKGMSLEKHGTALSPGKDAFDTKKSNSPGREPTLSPEGNKVDPIPLGTTLERRVSSNKGMSLEKHGTALSPGKDAFDTKKSNSPGREPTLSPEENKVDPIPLGTTLERRVSSNKGMSLEKHDTDLSPGMSHTADKTLSPDKHPTHNSMEIDAHPASSEHEIVTPMVKEIFHNSHQDTSKRDSAADDTSSKQNGAGDRPDTTDQNIHSMADTEGQKKSLSPKPQEATNLDHSQLSGTDPKMRGEKSVTPLKEVEDVLKAEVKAPNVDPPHINQSDVDLREEKEAKVSSITHDSKHEYDKHDSEQEFKREIPTDTTTVNTIVKNEEDRKQSEEKMDKREEKNIDTAKTKTSKGSNKNKKRMSPENEDDRTEEHKNSQENDKSDGIREENVDLTSPVISKEGIPSDNTKAQNAEDTASETSVI